MKGRDLDNIKDFKGQDQWAKDIQWWCINNRRKKRKGKKSRRRATRVVGLKAL